MEPSSGQVLFELNADQPRAVASVTKVMTILLALEALQSGRIGLDEQISVSKQAAGMGGSQVLLDVGEVQPFSVLLKSVIVGSANDAAVAVAEALYGSEELFVRRMNERAEELGLKNTNFVNTTGLPAEGQHTTARDVAVMTMARLEHPQYFEYAGVCGTRSTTATGESRIDQHKQTHPPLRRLRRRQDRLDQRGRLLHLGNGAARRHAPGGGGAGRKQRQRAL